MTNYLLRASGDDAVAFVGDYGFGDGTLRIPEVTTLPTSSVPVGTIYHVKNSGVLAVASGSPEGYAIFSLSSLAFIPFAKQPDEIDGISFWFKAESGTQYTTTVSQDTPAASGQPVSLWVDSGPNGHDSNAYMGLEPIWFANGISDGVDCLQFGPGLMNVSGVHTNLLGGTDETVTLCALLSWISQPVSLEAVYGGADSTNSTEKWLVGASGAPLYTTKTDDVAASVNASSGSVPGSELQFVMFRGNGTTLDIFQNGSGVLMGAPFNVGSLSLDNFAIGGYNDSLGTQPSMTAKVVELFAFSGALSNDDRRCLELYVDANYGSLVTISGV